jgi:hypothetical protein
MQEKVYKEILDRKIKRYSSAYRDRMIFGTAFVLQSAYCDHIKLFLNEK